MIGRTIRKVINEGTNSLPIQIKAKIIKEAIGVAFITVRIGEKIAYANFETYVMQANINAIIAPLNKPVKIRTTDSKQLFQNSVLDDNLIREFTVERGEGKITSNFTIIEIICQTDNQNMIAIIL